MARHVKKRKISRLWISVYSLLGLLFIASWVWLLLYFPPVSSRAEVFIKNSFLGRIFITEASGETEITDEGTAGSVETDDGQNQPQESKKPEIDTSETDEQVIKPAIQLVIDEGPAYDAKEDACYYIVKAVVSGKPEPTIQFSKDDSAGSLGSDRARVNLKRNLRTYILTATAANPAGTAMDSITLNWGCNSPPVIIEVRVSSDIVYVNEQYELSVTASDAENDKLEYKWAVDGGSLGSDNQPAVKWNTPSVADDYVVKVEVKDSTGGAASKSISVYVGTKQVSETTQPPDTTPPTTAAEPPETEPTTTEPQESKFDLTKKTGEGGYLEFGGQTFPGGNLYAGDSASNKPCVGFISFDISNLGGKTVESATLTLNGATVKGEPLSYLDAFWVNIVEWGAEPITQSDFTLIGIAVQSFNKPKITCDSASLKSGLQNAINSGKSRFQIRVHFSGPYTDNDNARDGWEYSQSNINLNITVK